MRLARATQPPGACGRPRDAGHALSCAPLAADFLSVAKDLETGRVYYEDYVALLTEEA